jgi:SAM-dependent methyltransferase
MRVEKARWPLSLTVNSGDEIEQIRIRAQALAEAAQYGWGHTIDFGPFRQEGFLGDSYLMIAGTLDHLGWWPSNLSGAEVADIGCFTGALTLFLAARGASRVYAVDEVPEHLDQCRFLSEVFGLANVHSIEASIYQLNDCIPSGSLDLILCAGVLYHLSDMLVGLYAMRLLLKPGGSLVIETNAIDDNRRSYANFGRFFAGMWWQPTSLCIRDMCEFMGYVDTDIHFHRSGRCLVRTTRGSDDIPFKRGMNWQFESLRDAETRSTNRQLMAPARQIHGLSDRLRIVGGKFYRRYLGR